MFILLALPKQQLKRFERFNPKVRREKTTKKQFTFAKLITHILLRIAPFLLLFA
jgi:hypothetical protein